MSAYNNSTDIDIVRLYRTEINSYSILNKEDERKLLAAAQSGDIEAQNKLIEHNMRLVKSIANGYKCSSPLLAENDLIQVGSLGLFDAIRQFDLSTSYKFSTFATYHIQQKILYEISRINSSIRKPANICALYKKIKSTSAQLRQELQTEPTVQQIAQELNITPKRIKEVQSYFIDPISIDLTLSQDDDSTIGDMVEDESINDPINSVFNDELHCAIKDVLQTLSEKERKVIELRFGLDGGPQRSLSEVGKILGYSHEWMRQIEEKALSKLRQPIRKNKLQHFFDEEKREGV